MRGTTPHRDRCHVDLLAGIFSANLAASVERPKRKAHPVTNSRSDTRRRCVLSTHSGSVSPQRKSHPPCCVHQRSAEPVSSDGEVASNNPSDAEGTPPTVFSPAALQVDPPGVDGDPAIRAGPQQALPKPGGSKIRGLHVTSTRKRKRGPIGGTTEATTRRIE